MRREKLEDWARLEFIKLLGPEGDGIWTEAEDLLKRKRLIEFVPQEGRVNARFSGEKPIRCQLIVPIVVDQEKADIFKAVKASTLSSAMLLADKLPWNSPEFEALIAASSFIPVNFNSSSSDNESDEPTLERFTAYSTAAYLELIRRFESDPGLFFSIRGLGREELIAFVRDSRSELWRGVVQKGSDDGVVFNKEDVESAKPELFNLTYQLRADELPALLFKRVEGIPLTEGADIVDSVLTDLYAHIAKRAQAYGLSMGR
jgi:uncharacterized Zn finger protein